MLSPLPQNHWPNAVTGWNDNHSLKPLVSVCIINKTSQISVLLVLKLHWILMLPAFFFSTTFWPLTPVWYRTEMNAIAPLRGVDKGMHSQVYTYLHNQLVWMWQTVPEIRQLWLCSLQTCSHSTSGFKQAFRAFLAGTLICCPVL